MDGGEATDRRRPRFWSAHLLLVSGIIIVVVASIAFLRIGKAPQPVEDVGAATIFVNDPKAKVRLRFDLPNYGGADLFDSASLETHPDVTISLDFEGFRSIDSFQWALVLSRNAKVVEGKYPTLSLSRGAELTHAQAPFGFVPTDILSTEPVQIIVGSAKEFWGDRPRPSPPDTAALILGRLQLPVASSTTERAVVALPEVGKYSFFLSPNEPKPLGIDGDWYSPAMAGVAIDLGPISPLTRVESVSPPLEDLGYLNWKGADSVRAQFAATDLRAEQSVRNEVFVIGVLLSAGASFIVAALQMMLSRNAGRRDNPATGADAA